MQKIGKKEGELGKYRKNREKSGRKGKTREGSFTLPLLTDRDGYATDESSSCMFKNYGKIHVKATIMFFKNEITHTDQILTMCVHYQILFHC